MVREGWPAKAVVSPQPGVASRTPVVPYHVLRIQNTVSWYHAEVRNIVVLDILFALGSKLPAHPFVACIDMPRLHARLHQTASEVPACLGVLGVVALCEDRECRD